MVIIILIYCNFSIDAITGNDSANVVRSEVRGVGAGALIPAGVSSGTHSARSVDCDSSDGPRALGSGRMTASRAILLTRSLCRIAMISTPFETQRIHGSSTPLDRASEGPRLSSSTASVRSRRALRTPLNCCMNAARFLLTSWTAEV